MELFWKMVDGFKKYIAGSALKSFAPIDWIILALLFWGLVQGSRRGFTDMFGRLVGVFLLSMLTLSFYELGAQSLVMLIPALPMNVAKPFAFVLWSICSFLIIFSGINFFGKFLKLEAHGIFKTFGGMLIGLVNMALLMSFVVQFLLFLPIGPLQQSFKEGRTYTGYTIAKLAPDLQGFLFGFVSGGPAPKFKPTTSFKAGS